MTLPPRDAVPGPPPPAVVPLPDGQAWVHAPTDWQGGKPLDDHEYRIHLTEVHDRALDTLLRRTP